ncbi:helix-turn-helix domain-containing protein [Sporosarcina psychrophila]|uniref:helix-turn-helix domain-containing protein n=1 Tax=Sporosarcina psychrophila TaxID=1476 RepID=UPI003B9DE369
MEIGSRIKVKRKENRFTQIELAKLVNVSPQVISNWERGYSDLSSNDVSRLADALNCSTEYLLGKTESSKSDWNSKLPELTAKDERDITVDLEKMINNLESKDGYAAYDGHSMDDMDEEDKELLKASLENSLRLAKRIAKQKFTPIKYRD